MKFAFALTLVALASATEADVLFKEWQVQYGKTYASDAEAQLRLKNFRANLATIASLNARSGNKPNAARFGMNKFGDLSLDEQKALRGLKVPARDTLPAAAPVKTQGIPGSVDWRTTNMVAPIQDQGSCGSCWAFSTTSNIESTIAIANNATIVKLSEQNLVDCDHTCGTYRGEKGCDQGCGGGLQPNAFRFVMSNGQVAENKYPYQGFNEKCEAAGIPAAAHISNYTLVSTDEAEIAAYVAQNGPVSVAVDAAEWTWYYGGVMEYLCWGKEKYDNLDHAVNIVGYGKDGDTPYWIIRNSWSTSWGEDGYARIYRGSGFCGVNLFACSAIA